MTLKERWKSLSLTEKLMIISIILLLITLATRFTYTVGRVKDGVHYLQGDTTSVKATDRQ